MSELSDDQVRYEILRVLHGEAREKPISVGLSRNEMQEILKVSARQMDFNMLYLEEKGLVKLLKYLGSPWGFAKINAFGADVFEHKERYAGQFPFI